MASKILLGALLGVGSVVVASPVAYPGLDGDAIYARHHLLLNRQTAGTCQNQSCEIATIAGSTGLSVYPYMSYPTGDSQEGDCCIIQYFPAIAQDVYENRPGLQAYCEANDETTPLDSNPPGVTSVSVEYPPSTTTAAATTTSAGLFGIFARQTATCAPKILIYAKGTLETGEYGNTLGPEYQTALPSDWSIVGVEYDNSLENDYCLGLPGGVTARGILNETYYQCPGSILAMSGYSQGAMVVRNALARAPQEVVDAVKSVVTFGDPFVGAQIGQYSGPLHVFCNEGDGVCNGQLDITLQHLAYGGDVSTAVSLLVADTS